MTIPDVLETADRRPHPRLDGPVGEYYAWLKQEQLRLQRCDGCGRWRGLPRVRCPWCHSDSWSWRVCAGVGVVYSWTVTHVPVTRGFAKLPYAVLAVELSEGPRIMAGLAETPTESLYVGMPVEVVFEQVTEALTVASFRSVRGRSSQPTDRTVG
jgi:uncharacterized OB-fold protein